jgi:LacI family transcriptional regulator
LTTARLDDDFTAQLRADQVPLDLGHRRIGVIAGPTYASGSVGRVHGYRKTIEEAGLAVDDQLIRPSTFGMESGEDVPLSTVRVPFAQIADAAVELLNRRADEAASSVHRVAAPTLIPRRSTTRPKTV